MTSSFIRRSVRVDARTPFARVVLAVVMPAVLGTMLGGGFEAKANKAAPAGDVADGATRDSELPDGEMLDVTEKYLRNVETRPKKIDFAVPFNLVITLERKEGERLSLPREIPQNKKVRPAGRPTRERAKTKSGSVIEEISIPFIALDTEKTKTPPLLIMAPGGRIEIGSIDIDVVDYELELQKKAEAERKKRGADKDQGALDELKDVPATSQGVERARRNFLYNIADARPWAVLSTLLASLLALISVILIDRKRVFAAREEDAVDVTERTPVIPAHITALARLDALLASNLLREGDVEGFVEKLMNDVLRQYLEQRFDIPAESQTTAELAEELFAVSHAALDVAAVKSILEDADLVKFARAEMQKEVAHQMASKVRQLIESTAERAGDEQASERAPSSTTGGVR